MFQKIKNKWNKWLNKGTVLNNMPTPIEHTTYKLKNEIHEDTLYKNVKGSIKSPIVFKVSGYGGYDENGDKFGPGETYVLLDYTATEFEGVAGIENIVSKCNEFAKKNKWDYTFYLHEEHCYLHNEDYFIHYYILYK